MLSIKDVTVILASSSPRRTQLLDLVGIRHEVRPADIDESLRAGESPQAYAERLAREKAETIAENDRSGLVVAADTIVVIDDVVMGNPRDVGDESRMLGTFSGRSHTVITAVVCSFDSRIASDVEVVDVTFMPLTDDGIQGYGATIVRRIDGDYFAVMGLPLVRMVSLMRQVGVSYDFPR